MELLEDRDTPSVVLSTSVLPVDVAGESYTANLTATGGSGQYQFAVASGKLPSGLSLNSTGALSGTTTSAGSYTFRVRTTDAANSTLVGTKSFILTVSPGALESILVAAPTTVTAGAKATVKVTAEDSFGNIETGYNGPVTLTTSDGQIPTVKTVALSKGVGRVKTALDKVDTLTLTATAGSVTGTSGNVTVNPGAANKFTISAPTTTIAGTGFTVTIAAFDAHGNLATRYTGTAILTASDKQVTSHTSIALSSGTASATITLSKADTLRITATAGTIKGTSASISVQPGSGTGWISQKLSNASLAALAEKDFTRDNTITYSDILGLFADAESEGSTVSSATLSSLQALASSGAASALSIPASVRNLLSSVVDGDPANAVIASGNLKVGSTVGQLQTLVSDWFLGADHPSAVTIYGTATYQLVSGTLFGSGGPSYEDVYQGQMGDCWLLASFGATAANDPSVIQNMFTDDGIQTVNGTQIHVWTVEFHDNGVPHYVTVDNNLPTVYGCFFFANQGESASSSSNVLWVPLLEKAYAQLCASGWNQRPQTNAYQSLNGGNASTVLPVLTGRAEASDPYTNAGLISALGAGRLMTLASYEDVPSLGIVGSHDYVLMGYNASTQTFTLVNPWGWNTDYTNDGAAAPGILHLRWSQVHQYFMLDGDDNPAA